MAKTKARAANMPIPQTRDQATTCIREIGAAQREVARIEADANDRITAIKADALARASVFSAQVKILTEGLRVWADANREALTDGHKVKFADLGTGKLSWRSAPPKVTISGVESVIEALRRLDLGRFLRTKVEIDKDAMRAEPETARLVPGVSIGSAGEDFAVEPFEVDLVSGMEAA